MLASSVLQEHVEQKLRPVFRSFDQTRPGHRMHCANYDGFVNANVGLPGSAVATTLLSCSDPVDCSATAIRNSFRPSCRCMYGDIFRSVPSSSNPSPRLKAFSSPRVSMLFCARPDQLCIRENPAGTDLEVDAERHDLLVLHQPSLLDQLFQL